MVWVLRCTVHHKKRKGEKTMKKIIALLLALCMLFALVACGNKSADTPSNNAPADTGSSSVKEQLQEQEIQKEMETAEVDNTYTRPSITLAQGTATTLTPWGTKNGTPGAYEVYEMLYECDAKGEMYPLLADATYNGSYMPGCDHEKGSGVYTVKIYDYIKDHKGNEITASDVAFSFMHQFQNEATSGWNDLQTVEAKDDTTVVFTFAKEQSDVGQLLNIFCRQFIVDENEYKADEGGFSTTMCGTGPYKFDSYTSGSSLTIVKNEDYWQTNADLRRQEQQANVEKITYQFIDETSQKVIALKTGAVDFVAEMSADGCKDFLDGGEYADKFNVYAYQAKFVNYLSPNCSPESIMSDINMRLAVFNAVDRQGLVTALGGIDTPLTSYATSYYSDYSYVDWAAKDNYNTREGVDSAAVKDYLTKAGYNGEKVVLVSQNGDAATVVAGMLQAQGINCEAKILDRNSAQAVAADPTAWDLDLGMMAGDFNVTVWLHGFSYGNTDGTHTQTFVVDQEWEDLLNLCCTEDGHTPENLEKWWDHAVENAYTMGLYAGTAQVILPEDMTVFVQGDKLTPLTGASTYAAPEA